MLKYVGMVLLLVAFASCRKSTDAVLPEEPVAKKIEFHVHASPAYTGPYYDNVTAGVQLAIYKINYRNGQSQLLWDTAFDARRLAEYPNLPQKFLVEKSYEVLESKEKLQASFSIRYQTPDGPSQEMRAEELVPGSKFVFLDVDI